MRAAVATWARRPYSPATVTIHSSPTVVRRRTFTCRQVRAPTRRPRVRLPPVGTRRPPDHPRRAEGTSRRPARLRATTPTRISVHVGTRGFPSHHTVRSCDLIRPRGACASEPFVAFLLGALAGCASLRTAVHAHLKYHTHPHEETRFSFRRDTTSGSPLHGDPSRPSKYPYGNRPELLICRHPRACARALPMHLVHSIVRASL